MAVPGEPFLIAQKGLPSSGDLSSSGDSLRRSSPALTLFPLLDLRSLFRLLWPCLAIG
jgi:hypothetical protein